ncbi:hypothetical protein ACL03H_07170 [Saccharopolyspora sp. MS10]|uniref:hypothetical protein n=1 Tax=Saccharopolyspora sp. MS10 TaxID=3385973 RepID=UPI0039A0910D
MSVMSWPHGLSSHEGSDELPEHNSRRHEFASGGNGFVFEGGMAQDRGSVRYGVELASPGVWAKKVIGRDHP